MKRLKIITVIIAILIGGLTILPFISAKLSLKIYNDNNKYTEYRKSDGIEHFDVEGMEIWPEFVGMGNQIEALKLVYYNPFDSNYIGYMIVKYSEEEYTAEIERLKSCRMDDYEGLYGAKEFEEYELYAMCASYDGFIYALGDKPRIIYVELIFPGYCCDLDYTKYIPADYLPKGVDVSENNPVRMEHMH